MRGMNAGVIQTRKHKRLLQLTVAMGILILFSACATQPSLPQQYLDVWIGAPVEALDSHPFFSKELMFRTRTTGGTEIRNYANGYNFGECFGKAGARKVGDFVDEDIFVICSSGRIVCNNLFYIREAKVLQYAPTGLCHTDEKVQPEAHFLKLNRK